MIRISSKVRSINMLTHISPFLFDSTVSPWEFPLVTPPWLDAMPTQSHTQPLISDLLQELVLRWKFPPKIQTALSKSTLFQSLPLFLLLWIVPPLLFHLESHSFPDPHNSLPFRSFHSQSCPHLDCLTWCPGLYLCISFSSSEYSSRGEMTIFIFFP